MSDLERGPENLGGILVGAARFGCRGSTSKRGVYPPLGRPPSPKPLRIPEATGHTGTTTGTFTGTLVQCAEFEKAPIGKG
jgi:hypothetical protein